MKTFLKTYKSRVTILLLTLLIVNIIAIRIFEAPLKNEVCKGGIVSFELAKDLDKTVKILDSWDVNAKINMSLSLGFDFLFIMVYSSFIALLIFNVNTTLWEKRTFYKVGNLLIGLIFIAALFDIVENIALIKLLNGSLEQIWSSVAFYFASAKFTIILISIAYLLVNWILLIFNISKKTLRN